MLLEQAGDAKGLLVRRNMFCQKHVARNDSLRLILLPNASDSRREGGLFYHSRAVINLT